MGTNSQAHCFIADWTGCVFGQGFFCYQVWKCDTWVWSLVQLPNDEVHVKRRTLWSMELVWLRFLVSIRKSRWGNCLPRADDDQQYNLLVPGVNINACEYKACLCVFGTNFLSIYRLGDVFADLRRSCTLWIFIYTFDLLHESLLLFKVLKY